MLGAALLAVACADLKLVSGGPYWIAILSPAGNGEVDFGYHDQPSSTWEHSASDSLSTLPCKWVGSTVQGSGFGSDTECSFYASE